jgi:hypothetical protein
MSFHLPLANSRNGNASPKTDYLTIAWSRYIFMDMQCVGLYLSPCCTKPYG